MVVLEVPLDQVVVDPDPYGMAVEDAPPSQLVL
jgi:hypothetical protein